jgi:rubredoxin
MAKYRCTVCNWVYDEEKEGKKFTDLQRSGYAPSGAPASAFVMLAEQVKEVKASEKKLSILSQMF